MHPRSLTHAVWLLLITAITTTASGISQRDEANTQTPQTRSTLHVGGITTINSPPYNWVSRCEGPNKSIGSTRHLMDKIFKELNVDVDYAPPLSIRSETIRKRFSLLKEGKYDAITGVIGRQAKNGIIIGEEPLVVIDIGILYKQDIIDEPESMMSLKGFRGSIPFFFSYIATNNLGKEAISTLNLKKSKTLAASIELLLNDEVDYVITNSHRARITMLDMKINSKLDYKSLDEFTLNTYLAFNEGSRWESLLPKIDQKLKEVRASGYVDHLEKTYLISWQRNKDCTYDDL